MEEEIAVADVQIHAKEIAAARIRARNLAHAHTVVVIVKARTAKNHAADLQHQLADVARVVTKNESESVTLTFKHSKH